MLVEFGDGTVQELNVTDKGIIKHSYNQTGFYNVFVNLLELNETHNQTIYIRRNLTYFNYCLSN